MNIKKLLKITGTAAVCSFCLVLANGFVSSANETETETTMAATTYVNVRDAAGTNGNILGVLSPSDAVAVTGITNGWYDVNYDGHHGYVYHQWLNFEGSNEDGDVANGKETDMQSTVYLNVRSGAGTGYKVLDVLSPNQKVQVIGKKDGWYKVKHNNQTGYVWGQYLDFLTSNSGFETKTMTVNCNAGVNFRSGASESSSIIGGFAKGTQLTITGKEGSWWQVTHNGTVGYVHDANLSEGAVDYSAEGKTMTTTAPLNLRTSASTSARVIKVIPQNTAVKILSKEGDWYIVDYKGDSGSVYGQYLK